MNAYVLLYIFQSLYRESISRAVRLALALGTGVDVICTLTKQCAIISLFAWLGSQMQKVSRVFQGGCSGRQSHCLQGAFNLKSPFGSVA